MRRTEPRLPRRAPASGRAGAAGRLAAGAAILATCLAGAAFAAPLPDPVGELERPVRQTFDLVPLGPGGAAAGAVPETEGARFTLEETVVAGQRYAKATLVFPLPDDEQRERVLFFAKEKGVLRLLGFHRLRRVRGRPEGETVVLDSGGENPMRGETVTVPEDTYTWLGLWTALRGLGTAGTAADRTRRFHLLDDAHRILPAEATFEGEEDLDVLGARLRTRRIRVAASGGGSAPPAGEARLWFSIRPPYPLLRYEGPGDFLPLADADAPRPPVRARATSSSEQIRALLESLPGAACGRRPR